MHPAPADLLRFSYLDEVPEGVCVMSENLVVVFWNRRLEAWTGVPRERIAGDDIRTHFPGLACGEARCALEGLFREAGAGELPEAFGAALVAAPRSLRAEAVPLGALDVCRYALLFLRDASDVAGLARRVAELELAERRLRVRYEQRLGELRDALAAERAARLRRRSARAISHQQSAIAHRQLGRASGWKLRTDR